ncbi:MAG: PQQ-binding-like beta-propeller repeat protein [Peptococcaceae bacterium]|nr:PQQ-binding-like beta-propeller repeat protein [Peptococcaceae bacterium]
MRWLISLLVTIVMCFAIFGAPAKASDWKPTTEWKMANMGKLSSDLQIGPNGLFYGYSGNKLTVFDDKGQKLWDVTNKSGSGNNPSMPVFDYTGSVFMPGNNMFQEIKLNGSTGWNFNVYAQNSSAQSLLTAGPGRLLYLHAPTGLYAVDTVGRYRWMLNQWDMARNTSTKMETFKVIAAAGDSRVVLSVVARDKGAAQLFAFNQHGEMQWRFPMGEVKNVNLVFGPDELLYVTANPAKVTATSNGALYAFDVLGNGKPLWTYRLQSDKLSIPTPTNHNQLYFMEGDMVFALDQSTGKEIWSNVFPKANTQPAVDENSKRVYLGGDNNRLIALRPDGRMDWWLDMGSKISRKPLIAPDGYLYVTTDKGDIFKIKDQRE